MKSDPVHETTDAIKAGVVCAVHLEEHCTSCADDTYCSLPTLAELSDTVEQKLWPNDSEQ